MEKLTISRIQPSEVELLLQLSRKIFYESFNHLNTPENMQEYMDRAFNKKQLLSELENPHTEFYFLLLEDEPVGYLKLNLGAAQSDLQDNDSIEIERIYVDQTQQGKGLGTILLEKAKERACELRLQYIWLGVWEKNPGAIRFYERYGFHIFSSHKFRMGDEVQTDLLMRYDL